MRNVRSVRSVCDMRDMRRLIRQSRTSVAFECSIGRAGRMVNTVISYTDIITAFAPRKTKLKKPIGMVQLVYLVDMNDYRKSKLAAIGQVMGEPKAVVLIICS